MQTTPETQAPPAGEPEAHEISPHDLLQFAVRATRRHIVLGLAVGLAVGFVGFVTTSCIPNIYEASTKIFIEDSVGMTSSLTSGKSLAGTLEGARALDEFILARDNLAAIVREAQLYDTWPRTRPLPMRIKDRLVEAMFGPPDRHGMERAFVEMLAASITARKDGESVRITASWRDPQNTYDITRLVQRNFLAARAAHELGPLQRAIPFLENELESSGTELVAAIEAIAKAYEDNAPAAPQGKPSVAALMASASGGKSTGSPRSVELMSLSRELTETRQKIRELVTPNRDRVAALKLELIEMQASYSPDHPRVLQQQARIAAASEISSEVKLLKARESELLAQLSRAAVRPADGGNAANKGEEGAPETSLDRVEATVGGGRSADDYELIPAKARLGLLMKKSDDLASRLQTARITLATAEGDFQHRYIVIEQPDVPGVPLKNKKGIFYLASVIASLLTVVGTATLREFRRGRIVELWQVRTLGLPVLGEVRLQALPRGDGDKS